MHSPRRALSRPLVSRAIPGSRLVKQGVSSENLPLPHRQRQPALSVLFLLIASAAACIGFPRTAFAGYYKVSYKVSNASPTPTGHYGDYSNSDRHDSEGFANLGGSSDPGTASCSGAIEANFTWTPSYVGDTSLPPKDAAIVESSSAHWSTNAGTQAAGSCSDGLGGTPTNHIEESNPSGRQVMYSGRGESSGNRTTPLHDPGVTITRTCNPQAQASGRDAQVFVQYSAVVYPRSVIISSPTIEPSTFAGANDPDSGDPIPTYHVRALDGSIVTDSVVSYYPGNIVGAAHWLGETSLEATINSLRSDTLDFLWSSEGAGGFDQIGTLHSPGQGHLALYFPGGDATNVLGETSKVKATVTFADGGVTENTFTINWHWPYENWVVYPGRQAHEIWQYPVLDIANPGYAIYGGSIGLTWSEYSAYWAVWTETGGYLLGILSASPNPVYAAFFATAQVASHEIAPQPETGSASFDSCWDMPESDFPEGRPSGPGDKSLYRMTPRLMIGYTVTPYQADSFSQNGYTGKHGDVIAKRNGRMQFSGEFHLTVD